MIKCLSLLALLRFDAILPLLQYIELINHLMDVLEERIYISIVLSLDTICGSLWYPWSLIVFLFGIVLLVILIILPVILLILFPRPVATRCTSLSGSLLVKSLLFKGAHQVNPLDGILNPMWPCRLAQLSNQ